MAEKGGPSLHFSGSKFSLFPFGSSMAQVERKWERKGYHLQLSWSANALSWQHSNANAIFRGTCVSSLEDSVWLYAFHCSLTQKMLTHCSSCLLMLDPQILLPKSPLLSKALS